VQRQLSLSQEEEEEEKEEVELLGCAAACDSGYITETSDTED
jgi:hypothetical protein